MLEIYLFSFLKIRVNLEFFVKIDVDFIKNLNRYIKIKNFKLNISN